MGTRFKFRPMLGPASRHPVGSAEWAECLGNELDYTSERAIDYGVHDVLAIVLTAMAADIPPWSVWPQPTPCGSANAYFELCTGVTYDQLLVLFDTFGVSGGLPRTGN